jgi:hypothetical protein
MNVPRYGLQRQKDRDSAPEERIHKKGEYLSYNVDLDTLCKLQTHFYVLSDRKERCNVLYGIKFRWENCADIKTEAAGQTHFVTFAAQGLTK